MEENWRQGMFEGWHSDEFLWRTGGWWTPLVIVDGKDMDLSMDSWLIHSLLSDVAKVSWKYWEKNQSTKVSALKVYLSKMLLCSVTDIHNSDKSNDSSSNSVISSPYPELFVTHKGIYLKPTVLQSYCFQIVPDSKVSGLCVFIIFSTSQHIESFV